MDNEITIGGAIVVAGGLLAEVFRRWLRTLTAARLERTRLEAEARSRINETTARAVDAMIGHTRSEAQVVAAVDALRTAIEEAVEARRRDDAAMHAAVRDLERRVDDLAELMRNFQEFKRRVAFRPEKPGD